MTDPTLSLRRRQLLAGGAGALAGSGLIGLAGEAAAQASAPASGAATGARPLPAYVAWKDPSAVIVHSATTIETKRSAFGTSVVTPTEQLYIRNNLPAPDASIVANRDAWQVSIEGVTQPPHPDGRRSEDDRRGDRRDGAAVLRQRARLLPEQAERYAVDRLAPRAACCGAACRVRDVVEALGGVAPGMVYMTGTGGEKLPEGVDPLTVMVERSVPIKAMRRRAARVGDERRAVAARTRRPAAPDRAGLQRREQRQVREAPRLHAGRVGGHDQTTGYRITPPGEQVDPSQPSVWR